MAQGAIQGGAYAGAGHPSARPRAALPAVPLQRPRRCGRHRAAVGRHQYRWLGPFGRQGGFTAWALWLGIHIFYLIGFSNRIVVLVRWAWTFVTHGRGTRLITGAALLPPIEEPEPPVEEPLDPEVDAPGT